MCLFLLAEAKGEGREEILERNKLGNFLIAPLLPSVYIIEETCVCQSSNLQNFWAKEQDEISYYF